MKKFFSKTHYLLTTSFKKTRTTLKQYHKKILRELSILISKIIGAVILFMTIPLLVLVFINFLSALGIMINATSNSALTPQTLLQLFVGTFIILLTLSLYTIGLIIELIFKIINTPDKVIKTYIKITTIIERWYFLISIVIWAIISLSETFFNYFTILVSLIALLREMTEKQIGRVKIFPICFLESSDSSPKH